MFLFWGGGGYCFRPLRERGRASLWSEILLNLAENTGLIFMGWKTARYITAVQCDSGDSGAAIVLVCKAVVQSCPPTTAAAAATHPIIDQHSIPDFSNELGKQSFQNEFLNQCRRKEERGGEINK